MELYRHTEGKRDSFSLVLINLITLSEAGLLV